MADEIKRFGFSDNRPQMLFDSAGASEGYGSSKEQRAQNAAAAKAMDEVSESIKNLSPSQKAETSNMWSQMRGASEYNIFGQRAIDAISSMKKNEEVVVFDIESLGTPAHMRKAGSEGFFSPTELAFQKGKWMGNHLDMSNATNGSMSVLMKPDERTQKALSSAITQLRQNGWRGLSEDMQRSLVDLTAYSGDPKKYFKQSSLGKVSYTQVLAHAPKVSGNASLAMPDVISRIQQGFDNLIKHGTAPEHAIQVLDKWIPNKRGTQSPVRMIGYNIYNYDEQALKEFFAGNLAKDNPSSHINKALSRLTTGISNTKNVDLLHALKTTTPDPYGRFGVDMTLSNVHQTLGFKKTGTAHHGLSDVGYTAEIMGKVHGQVQKAQTKVQALSKGSALERTTAPFYWDKTKLKSNMELYAFNGISAYNSGTYDGVFTKNEDGTFAKKYGMKQNPIYARTVYNVDGFLNNVQLGGENHYGIQLSTNEGDTHFLFRKSQEELQQAIHGTFLPVNKYGIKREEALALQNEDRGRRRYDKMFQVGTNAPTSVDPSDGFNLMERNYTLLDEAKQFKKNGVINWKLADEYLKEKYAGERWMTDSYLRDLQTMAPRLEAEEQVWKKAMGEVKSNLGSNAERTIALHNFRNVLHENVGANKAFMTTGGEPTMALKMGEETKYLRGFNRNGMVQTIRSAVEGKQGGINKPNREVMINRFNQLIEDNLIPAFNNTGDKSMTKKVREAQKNFQAEILRNNKVGNIYEEVATMVGEYMNAGHATKGIELERVSSVSAQYASNLKGFDTGKHISGAIQDTRYYGQNISSLLATNDMQSFFGTQKKHAEEYLGHSNLQSGSLRNFNQKSFENITNVESKVQNLAERYMKAGFRVQMFNDEKRGLSMGIMAKDAPESLARSGYWGLRQSSQAAVIHLPSYGQGGRVQWRGEQHLNRFVGNIDRDGKLNVNTVYDDVFKTLENEADRLNYRYHNAKALGKQNFFIDTEQKVNRFVRSVLERSPMDYAKGYVQDDDAFHVRSARADFNRSMYIDTSGFAEQWYREQHANLSPDMRKKYGMFLSPEDMKSNIGFGDNFMNQMNWRTKARFNAEVDTWARDKFGLQADAHGVNDRHMSKGYRSLLDPRKMTAAGAFDKTSGENRQKALNYFALDENNINKSLQAQGETEAMIRLRTQYGTTSPFQDLAKGSDIDGVSMRAAYMSDDQVAKSIATNRAKIDTELKKMLGTGEITMEDYKRYESMLDNGQLTTYEGKAIMSNKFKKVFDTVDDVRHRLSDGYAMDGKLQSAMESHANKLGVKFNPNESIMFDKPMSVGDTQRLMDKDGMITVGRMTIDETKADRYDARSNKEVFVKGWNAEEQMLILGKHNRGDEGMKTVTNTGRRHTETFMPQKVLDIVSGIRDTEAIIPDFSSSKGMEGAKLEEKVRVYEDELLRQLHGAAPQSSEVKRFIADKKITVGDLTKNGQAVEGQAVRELLLPKLREHLNLSEQDLYERKGRVSFSDNFGFNPDMAAIAFEPDGTPKAAKGLTANFGQLDNEMGKMLNYQFRKDGVEVGQVIKQRHDVWADQYVTGKSEGKALEGRVRIGMKELTAMSKHMGEDNPFVGFLQDEVRTMAKGGKDAREVGQYIMNTMANGYAPKAGDVVFDTSAMRPEIDGDINARMGEGGVMYVNHDTANPLPEITAKDAKVYSDSYAQTLLDTGRIKVNAGEGTQTVKDYLKQGGSEYKGTAYLRLPDASFGQEYMPLVDFGNISREQGDGQFLNEMQRTQRSVISKVQEYNSLGKSGTVDGNALIQEKNRLQQNIIRDMSRLKEQANSYMTSGSNGSFLNSTANARLDMSGHFRAQGVNPFMQYSKDEKGVWQNTGKIKENVAYVNKHDVLDMIKGAEDNILSAWHDSKTMPQLEGMEAKQDYILKNMNDKGLFGPVIRYPIIDASTAQTAKYEVADWVDKKQMYLGTGAVSRIAGDFDGDNFAGMLTAYKTDKAKVYHSSLANMYEKERITSEEEGRAVMGDLEKDMLERLQENHSPEEAQRIMSTLQSGDMYTVQDLARKGFDQGTIDTVMRAKTHALDNTETVIARVGKEYIGHIDNARQRIQEMHSLTQKTLMEAEAANPGSTGVTRQMADESVSIVDEVTRRLSQDSISSKKFTVQTLLKDEKYRTMTQDQLAVEAKRLNTQRNDMLAQLRDDLYNPEMDIKQTMANMRDLGIIKEGNTTDLRRGVGRDAIFASMNDHELFEKGLTEIRNTNIRNQHVGGFNAAALKVGHSSGTVLDDLIQTGAGYAPVSAMKELHRLSNDETKARFDNYEAAYKAGVVRLHDQNSDAEQIMREGREYTQPKLEGRSVLEDKGFIEQKASTRFRDALDELIPKRGFGSPVAGSMAAGAVGFGAMWATSALMKAAPTPEGMREQQAQASGPQVPVNQLLTSPTARVTENNGEYINLKISTKNAKNMSHQEIAGLVNNELQSMSGVNMNMNLNVNDNSQQIDQKWLQDLVANAINKGYGFSTNN